MPEYGYLHCPRLCKRAVNHRNHLVIVIILLSCSVVGAQFGVFLDSTPLKYIPDDALRATKSKDSSFRCKFSASTIPSPAVHSISTAHRPSRPRQCVVTGQASSHMHPTGSLIVWNITLHVWNPPTALILQPASTTSSYHEVVPCQSDKPADVGAATAPWIRSSYTYIYSVW